MQPKINYREKEKQVLDQILGPTSYDARIRPSGINGTGMFIYSLILINKKIIILSKELYTCVTKNLLNKDIIFFHPKKIIVY
ncbi:hypothetical protein O3M35_006648 [Rhynocoris fuscipes]|uniref:Uncharacterized protein n=1 Tax=Rhynocoris fuscipes TaxID=488301 RepID=A0AAW1DE81_9HEMI